MILRGARVALGPEEAVRRDIEIGNGVAGTLDLDGELLLPGLINAHDHLEFSLYPRLGRGPYANAGEWARDIYKPDQSPIKEQLAVPKRTRLFWGGVKNLLSAVTTVCHHNPWEPVFERNFPVRVVKRLGWAHSLEFSPDAAERLRATPPEWPFILHLGEGSDRQSAREIFEIDAIGALDDRTVLTHAIALGSKGLRLAKEKRASIIWCPSSNLFLLGRTLNCAALDSGIPIALGSDSPLTAKGDLLDEIRLAKETSRLPASRLYRMVTEEPARILRLGRQATDIIAIRDDGRAPSEALMRAESPDLVIVRGKVKLMSAELARRVKPSGLQPLHVEGRGEFLIDTDIAHLRRSAERSLGSDLRLAGRPILA
jgi:cytosine/adenosine deaminase-related metal-dependent hydrolase